MTPAARARADAALERERDAPVPPDLQAPGCVTALVGMALLTLGPAAAPFVPAVTDWGTPLLVAAVALLLGGAGLALVGGSRRSRWVEAQVEQALAELEDPEALLPGGHPDPALRPTESRVDAAVRLLWWGVVADGPVARASFDPERMARRLGPSLALVRAVEAHLVERGRMHPVFGDE